MASQADQPELSTILVDLQDLRRNVKKLQGEALPSRVDGLFEICSELEGRIIKLEHNGSKGSTGAKTSARIAKLKEILKARGGSQTFQKLQEDLDLSPSEFTYLVSRLDKRSFEVLPPPWIETRREGPEPPG